MSPQVATFYGLPKVQKGIHPFNCRSIVSGTNNLTQNIGVYLYQILHQFVLSLTSYIRDTYDFRGFAL